jgi:hypothetical protein
MPGQSRGFGATTINTDFLNTPEFKEMFKDKQIDNDEFRDLMGMYRDGDSRKDDTSLAPLQPGMLDKLFDKLEIDVEQSAELKKQMAKLLLRLEDQS